VASALLEHSFNAFHGAGLTHAMLGVDTENPTGALGIYERLGFEPVYGSIICQREVTPS
jgi:ribosomal protein S18 acetylase RimI-like enzyme